MPEPARRDAPAQALRAASAEPEPPVRAPVAVVISRFPVVTETFILREIVELERRGQPVILVPLLRERGEVVHPEARSWIPRAWYTPFLSPAIVAANVRAFRRDPRTYLRILGALVRAHAGSADMLARTLALFPKAVWIAERLAASGVGHVHAHFVTHPGTVAWVVHQLTGIPYSLTAHAHDIFVRRDMLGAKLAGARFVRCISAYNRDFLSFRHPGEADKLRVVHVGVPARRSPPQEAAPVARIVCVAALKPYKGHFVLLDACARMRKAGIGFECLLVGEGPLRARIESEIRNLGLADIVTMLGAQPEERVTALMDGATVVVQPSVVAADGQMEGIPVALMEAMMAGKPVVASALSGIPELVRDGVSGLLVPPADAEALAAALHRVLTDPGLGARMGHAGRRIVEREFELGATAEALMRALDPHRLPASARWVERIRGTIPSTSVGLRRVHERIDSSVAEVILPGPAAPRELVVKVHVSDAGTPSPAAARREFEALGRLHGVIEGIPRPLHLEPGGAAIVMEACPGVPLAERIRRSRWGTRSAHGAVLGELRRAGAWLRELQQRTRGDATAGGIDAVVGAALAHLEAARLPRTFARLVSAGIARRAALLGTATVGRHGDLWPGNILVGDGRIHVVDFEGFGRGFPYEDPAYFVTHLELFYSYPSLATRRRLATDAFLEGYTGRDPVDPSAWRLFRTAALLQELDRDRPGPGRTVRGWWRRRALLRMLGEGG